MSVTQKEIQTKIREFQAVLLEKGKAAAEEGNLKDAERAAIAFTKLQAAPDNRITLRERTDGTREMDIPAKMLAEINQLRADLPRQMEMAARRVLAEQTVNKVRQAVELEEREVHEPREVARY